MKLAIYLIQLHKTVAFSVRLHCERTERKYVNALTNIKVFSKRASYRHKFPFDFHH